MHTSDSGFPAPRAMLPQRLPGVVRAVAAPRAVLAQRLQRVVLEVAAQRAVLPQRLLLLLAVAALCACAPARTRTAAADGQAVQAGSPAAPLPMEACLDPDRARSWVMVDSDELLVDAGRRRYHLRLGRACPELGTAVELVFRGSGGLGRICGSAMDAVLPASRSGMDVPCPISHIRLLDEAAWQAHLDGDTAE